MIFVRTMRAFAVFRIEPNRVVHRSISLVGSTAALRLVPAAPNVSFRNDSFSTSINRDTVYAARLLKPRADSSHSNSSRFKNLGSVAIYFAEKNP